MVLRPSSSPWAAGQPVLLREVRQGQVWSAKPVTVVRDAPDLVALWLAPGTRWKQPRCPDGGRVAVVDVRNDSWVLTDAVWTDGGTLILHVPGAAHTLLGFWNEGHDALLTWYINLQAPLRRTLLGFDTLDHILDIVVSPRRDSWSWKDEDAFTEAQSRGLIRQEKACAIRAEGERALRLVLAGESPYTAQWDRWVPDPTWPVPTLPPGWETVIDQASGLPEERGDN